MCYKYRPVTNNTADGTKNVLFIEISMYVRDSSWSIGIIRLTLDKIVACLLSLPLCTEVRNRCNTPY